MQELNIVVINDFYAENADLLIHFFDSNTDYIFLHPAYDMYDLLIELEVFKSRSEARKNWTRTGKEIPPGYNEFKNIGRQKKALYIWNPVPYINNNCKMQQQCLIGGDCDPECEGDE